MSVYKDENRMAGSRFRVKQIISLVTNMKMFQLSSIVRIVSATLLVL